MLTFEQFIMNRHQCQIKSSVTGRRIALKDGHDATKHSDGKDGLILQFDANGCSKDECMELEYNHKERSKLVEYLYEKVPKHADIGC